VLDLSRFSKVLAFFAHPDDETLAAGGTMAKLSGLGSEVHVAIPATGIHSRRNTVSQEERDRDQRRLRDDTRRALGELGVAAEHIHLGEFPDNEMDKHSLLELIHWLEDVLAKVRPDLILTHHQYCTNLDHRYCHEAAVVATRPSLDSHVTVLSAEVPSSTGYLRPARWEPNFHVELTEAHLEAKVRAMNSYSSEVRPDPHPRSAEVIRALAKVRGSEAGFWHAEAFMVSKIFG
jgi:LmbE family N-acetylglucosaminyl deacetylase